LVILTHCCQTNDPIYLLSGKTLSGSGIAMPVFFFLSGLLVSNSLDHSSSRRNFLWKRFLRLYPAACLVVLLSACVLGPLLTTCPMKTYFSSPVFFQYLSTGLLVHVFYLLPGVFTHSPLGPFVNASLWSLSLELKLYAGLFLLSYIKNNRLSNQLVFFGMAVLIIVGMLPAQEVQTTLRHILWPHFALYPYTELTVYFLIGMICYRYRYHIKIPGYLIFLLPTAFLLSEWGHFFSLSSFVIIPAAVLFLAVNCTAFVSKITPHGDFSYGLYIWAFPIQQLVINYLYSSNPLLVFFITLGLTLLPAAASWYGVESKALKAKNVIT
jgi:peptidoglycan/LPS O-acetylase OafA/YrhL